MDVNRTKVNRKAPAAHQTHENEKQWETNKDSITRGNQLSQILENPGSASPSQILHLQRLAGNQAVSHFLINRASGGTQNPSIQAKLTVGPAGDQYEQEANRVADQVLSKPSHDVDSRLSVQRASEEDEEIQTKPLSASITPLVQRAEDDEDEIQTQRIQRQEEEEEIQAQRIQREQINPLGSFEAGADVEEKLNASRGSGSPLPETLRTDMEASFGADFSNVRLHTGSEAGVLNRQLNAQAFTHGQDIYIGEGKYDPGSSQGRHLLAHELTHVVQQNPGVSRQVKQQGSGTPPGHQRLQRLEVQNTDWGAATRVTASGEGGQGVLFFDDGVKKVIVKPNIHAAEEQIAAFVHAGAGGGPEGGYQIKALPLRIATQQDITAIRAAVQRIYGTNPIPDRVSMLLDQIAPGTTMIQTMAEQGKGEGGTVGRRLMEVGSSEPGHLKRIGGGLKKESPLRALLKDPSMMQAIGRAAAMDIFLGNTDRFAGTSNFENWMMSYSKRAVYLIDNVVDRPEGQFETWQYQRGGQQTADFGEWARKPLVRMLANDQFNAIADAVWASDTSSNAALAASLISTMYNDLLVGFTYKDNKRYNFIRANQRAQIKAMLDLKLNSIKANFVAGLRAGKASIIGLNGGKLPDNFPVSTEAKRIYRARVLVLKGIDAEAALRQAMQEITDWQKPRRWVPARPTVH